MWTIYIACFLPQIASKTLASKLSTMFTDDQVIFSSNFNITRLLVPPDARYIQSNDIPSIFFTVEDPEGGSCIYVLEGLAAYEILDGGRDSTADYEHAHDNNIYFGAKDGLYKYNPGTLSAKRFGVFKDDILQLQKANGSDTIYILTADHKMYKLEKNATIKTRIEHIVCALEFVLDTSNNIYYIACKDRMIHIVQSTSRVLSLEASVVEEFEHIKLLRPAFIMEQSIPFFGDESLYILYANGTNERKEFNIKERPSAYSVDATLYLVVALKGKIYEFNVMDVLLKSMYGIIGEWPKDVTKIIISMMESAREGVMNHYNDLIL